jgi:hypothetical protein
MPTPHFGQAWLTMTAVLGLHVADEAAHDFLSWYNPIVGRIRGNLGKLPFPPTFTFWPWLLGLMTLTATLFALTPFAYEGRLWLRPFAYALGVINTGNGLLHLIASAILRRRVPGVLSAPVLLIGALWLLYATARLAG